MSGVAPGGLVFYTAEEKEDLESRVENAFADRAWIRFRFFSQKGAALPHFGAPFSARLTLATRQHQERRTLRFELSMAHQNNKRPEICLF